MRFRPGERAETHLTFKTKHIGGITRWPLTIVITEDNLLQKRFNIEIIKPSETIEIKKGLYVDQEVRQVLTAVIRKIRRKKGRIHVWADVYE